MFPTSAPSGSDTIPDNATFWMPKPEDISEDGIGSFFHNTWLIKDVPVREARRLRREERRIAELIGDLATTARDFDRIATIAENGLDPDEPDDLEVLTDAERATLDGIIRHDGTSALDSLELGVAGLVYALATVRIIPAASCRGHPGDRSWSDAPVVLFATTEYRARALQPLAAAAKCRFGIDAARPELLAVQGQSILDTMAPRSPSGAACAHSAASSSPAASISSIMRPPARPSALSRPKAWLSPAWDKTLLLPRCHRPDRSRFGWHSARACRAAATTQPPSCCGEYGITVN